ncbi:MULTISPECIES: hypothetical protein [Lactobacillus]|uniref:Uncharacterized protein n=2 Tax=Lactobacillus TaxID=1578 RepID=A0AA47GHS6_9LACO|nr:MULTISPECIES: hypothetical protein [Lactobacillus]UZX30547.1 hypothetical protein LDX53_09220 [Lactobacillus helsingborgensis]
MKNFDNLKEQFLYLLEGKWKHMSIDNLSDELGRERLGDNIQDIPSDGDGKKSEENKVKGKIAYESGDNTIPDFLSKAEKIPSYMQEEVAEHRRRMNSQSSLSEEDLVEAEGESVNTFKIGTKNLTMLKMRIYENNAPIYIPMNHAGTYYRHLDDLVGQRKKVAIDQFVQTNEGEADSEYILLGSIQQAEFTVGNPLYNQYIKEPKQVTSKVREGVITRIVEIPEKIIDSNGERKVVPPRDIVFFDYHGISLSMRGNDFCYLSRVEPLSKRAFIGQKIKFSITRVIKSDYRESQRAKDDVETGLSVPRGIRYIINTTRLPFIPDPADEIRNKLNSRTVFKAYIIGVDPVKGILVEVAPGWSIKGDLSGRSPFKPTSLDAAKHTPVTVILTGINFKTRSGRCTIIKFPQGVARTDISKMM